MARGPAYHCLSAQFAPVMARGPSSERALRRRPSYHSPFVSFTHLYGARPERASFSLPFCPIMARGPSGPAYHCFLCNLPPLCRVARPRSGPSVGSPVIICLLFHLPTFMARGPSGPAFHCLSAQSPPPPPVTSRGSSGPAYHCLLRNLPPLWHAAPPRSERSVGGPVIICLLFHLREKGRREKRERRKNKKRERGGERVGLRQPTARSPWVHALG